MVFKKKIKQELTLFNSLHWDLSMGKFNSERYTILRVA